MSHAFVKDASGNVLVEQIEHWVITVRDGNDPLAAEIILYVYHFFLLSDDDLSCICWPYMLIGRM